LKVTLKIKIKIFYLRAILVSKLDGLNN